MPQQNEPEPPCSGSWFRFAEKSQSDPDAKKSKSDFDTVLNFASANYGRQIDWFFKHRDRALAELGAIVAIEVGFWHVDFPGKHPVLAGLSFGMVGLLALVFGWTGITACERTYKAAYESVAVVNKVLWSMGMSGAISVARERQESEHIAPMRGDRYLLPERWVKDMSAHDLTTEDFVDGLVSDTKRTSFQSCLSICCLSALGCVIAAASILSLFFKK